MLIETNKYVLIYVLSVTNSISKYSKNLIEVQRYYEEW